MDFKHLYTKIQSIDHIDGVSITYGTSRKHLWSYAAGYNEYLDRNQAVTCPCSSYGGTPAPSFVRLNYYCESGAVQGTYFTGDLLWDGKGCTSSNSCCAQSNLPWFYCQILMTNRKQEYVIILHLKMKLFWLKKSNFMCDNSFCITAGVNYIA